MVVPRRIVPSERASPLLQYRDHGVLGVVDIWRVRVPASAIEVDEQHQRSPGGALVAVDERVIPCQTAGEHRGLVAQVRMELVVSEAGGRSRQSRVGEVDAARLRQ